MASLASRSTRLFWNITGSLFLQDSGSVFVNAAFQRRILGNFLAFGTDLWISAKAKPIRFCWISFPATGKASWWILLSPVCMKEILQQRRCCMVVNWILHARCCGFRTPSALWEGCSVVIGGLQRRVRENKNYPKQNYTHEAVQPWHPCTLNDIDHPDFRAGASKITIHSLPMLQQWRIFKC